MTNELARLETDLERVEVERARILGELEAARSGNSALRTPPRTSSLSPPLSPRSQRRTSIKFVQAHYEALNSTYEKLRFCSKAFFVQAVVVMGASSRRVAYA